MNRIDQIFARHRREQTKALMPFIVAGDPDLVATKQLLPALEDAGASIVELGIPFSDPIADGPVIQSAMTRAIDREVRPEHVLDMVASVRDRVELGLVAMISYSIVHRLSTEAFVKRCSEAGIDGLIVPDLPVESAEAVIHSCQNHNLTCSFLVSPTTPAGRARQIAKACTGFVYLLARAGVTGERDDVPVDLGKSLHQIRQATDLPVAVGFGISTAEQVRMVVAQADAAIVGSALVRRITSWHSAQPDRLVEHARDFVAELAQGLD